MMSDNVALSDVILFIVGMPENSPPEPEIRPRDDAAPSPAPPAVVVESSNNPPADFPTHLDGLAERARRYAEAASSANTRRAYAADWKHFVAWCRRQDLPAL